MNKETNNPLGVQPVNRLLSQFAIPSIISMLVGSLYNIVDQFFIGQRVGELGNAATNIAFPLSTSCLALALLIGIGGSSAFNLAMGSGHEKRAVNIMGNAVVLLAGSGLVLSIITLLFLKPLLLFFGSPKAVLPYAMEYTKITAFGFPFLLLSTGGGHLIRADGRPRITMLCNLVGAVLNTILDALFVFGLNLGMSGAALATIIGQIVSGALAIGYLMHGKTVTIRRENLRIKWENVTRIASLGMAPCSNQVAMMVVQIIMNNSLTHYGAASVYGDAIPLACAGIVIKVNQIFFSIVIGLSQGSQPVESFNYGAKNYDRVRKAFSLAATSGVIISIVSFVLFQIFPRQILGLFGTGEPEYFEFGVRFFRIFLFFIWLDALQPITSTFFTSIGKPAKGIFLSLTRQIIFFIPLLLILPHFMGIEGCIYCGPIADFLAAVVTIIMAFLEFKNMPKTNGE
mgnify:CR=1 FL=1